MQMKDELFKFLNKIENEDNFALSRWGDGEYRLLNGDYLIRSDGELSRKRTWTFTPSQEDQQNAAKKITDCLSYEAEGLYWGITCPECSVCNVSGWTHYNLYENKDNLTFASMFVNANHELFQERFPEVVKNKTIYFVGHNEADITNLPFKIERHFKVGTNAWLNDLDILDGSPPCSSFSIAGNREKDWGKDKKFREGQAEQVLDTLFFDFIDLAKELQPKVVIAENVKGLLMGKAKEYVKEIYRQFDGTGYYCQHWLLDASEILDEIKEVYLANENVIFLFACGPLSNYLITELWREKQNNTLLDIGSAFDLEIYGNWTRSFHIKEGGYGKTCEWISNKNL